MSILTSEETPLFKTTNKAYVLHKIEEDDQKTFDQ